MSDLIPLIVALIVSIFFAGTVIYRGLLQIAEKVTTPDPLDNPKHIAGVERLEVFYDGLQQGIIYEGIEDCSRYNEGLIRMDFEDGTREYLSMNNPKFIRMVITYKPKP